MQETIVIAFLARAGSGKTTAAQYLVDNYGAVIVSFATPLKEMARELFDLNTEQLYGDQKEVPVEGVTPRERLQLLGNRARQHIGETVWIDAAMNEIEKHEGGLVVIDDCRYPNEAEAISKLTKGNVIKIISPDRVSSADPDHPSEAGVDQVPRHQIHSTIINRQCFDIKYFYDQIDAFMEFLGIHPL